MASILAFGASLEETEAILEANVVVKRFEIKRGCQVTVMESGKLLKWVNIMVNEAASKDERIF